MIIFVECTDGFLRAVLIEVLGLHGDENIQKRCKKMFAEHLTGEVPISSDLQESVYKVIASLNSSSYYSSLITVSL